MSFALLLFLATLPARAAPCDIHTRAGEKCKVPIEEIYPTQFAVGEVDVTEKRKILRVGSKAAIKYLKDNRAVIVIGPGGKFYLLDRHHLTLAAHREGFTHTHAIVEANLSHLDEEDFWATMQRRGWVRLKDEKGEARTVAQLPRYLRDLKDDPYRSLAWIARMSKAFKKPKVPAGEFDWADRLRTRVPIEPGQEGWEKAARTTINLATEEESQHLPGYQAVKPSQRAAVQDKCWRNFRKLNLSF